VGQALLGELSQLRRQNALAQAGVGRERLFACLSLDAEKVEHGEGPFGVGHVGVSCLVLVAQHQDAGDHDPSDDAGQEGDGGERRKRPSTVCGDTPSRAATWRDPGEWRGDGSISVS